VTTSAVSDRIVATDYFDGPSEGFARISGFCFYFRRQSDDCSEEVSNFRYTKMEADRFNEVEHAVGATISASKVFVYSGLNHEANRIVDEALVSFRAKVEREGQSIAGPDFFEAMKSG